MKGYNSFQLKKFFEPSERKKRNTQLRKKLFERNLILGSKNLRRREMIEGLMDVLYQYQDCCDGFEISLFHSYMKELDEEIDNEI